MADAEKVRRIYNQEAASYDQRSRGPEAMRGRLFGRARGEVLEVGVGTGATFAHYPADLHRLTALDISEEMLARAEAKAARLPYPVELRRADFQTLPFADGAFDTVVSSLALCGISDPMLMFAEIKRVLRPHGQLLALEHIRPPNPILGAVTSVLDPLYHQLVGCHLNRPTPTLLQKAGFQVQVLERRMLGGMVALMARVEEQP